MKDRVLYVLWSGLFIEAFCLLSFSRYFLPNITSIFGQYIGQMMAQFSADPKNRWPSKDAAIYLVTSLATKAKTAKHGITCKGTF